MPVATVRSSRPPLAAGADIVERAMAAAATIDRREGGGVASNAAHLTECWQSPTLGADVLDSILLRG